MVTLLVTGAWVVVAGGGTRLPESDLAAAGAALYEFAVTESVKSLMSKEEQADARPPSPGPEYFWCDNCKTYHKNQAPGTHPQPGVSPVTRPPSPGLESYWCESCKSYHLRQDAPNPPGAAGPAASVASVQHSTPAAGAPVVARPPSPGEGYYWCEQCKTYHLRPTSPQQPGVAPTVPQAPLAGSAASSDQRALREDYYYCEQCKTYHHRQPAAQQPATNVSRIFGGGSNSPNNSPILNPVGSQH